MIDIVELILKYDRYSVDGKYYMLITNKNKHNHARFRLEYFEDGKIDILLQFYTKIEKTVYANGLLATESLYNCEFLIQNINVNTYTHNACDYPIRPRVCFKNCVVQPTLLTYSSYTNFINCVSDN